MINIIQKTKKIIKDTNTQTQNQQIESKKESKRKIETIHKKLFSNNTLLLVNGDGGIGKTTIASQYYHTYIHEYKHCIWYYVNTSIKDVFFTLAERLEIQFNPKNTEEENLNLIVSFLSDLEKPILFVIDNANKLEDLEETYYYLRKFNPHYSQGEKI